MSDFYTSLAQTFGPLVQGSFSLLLLFLLAWGIYAAAFWSEQKLIQTGNYILWMSPFLALMVGLLYGGLRFSGQLLYSTDGWDQWGIWNYTNQNCGVYILFVCVCLLIGAVMAMHKEKANLKI